MAWLAYHANIVESRSIWWVELEAALSAVPSTVPMINGWKIFHLISIERDGDVQGLDTSSCDDDSREWKKATQWFDDDLFVILKYFRLLERKEERFMSIEKLCKAFAFLIFFSFLFPSDLWQCWFFVLLRLRAETLEMLVTFSSFLSFHPKWWICEWRRRQSRRLISYAVEQFARRRFFFQEWIQLLCDDVRINHEEIRFFRSNFHKIDVDSSKSVNLRFKFKWYEWLPRHMELMM